jgi:hypothetical protein
MVFMAAIVARTPHPVGAKDLNAALHVFAAKTVTSGFEQES